MSCKKDRKPESMFDAIQKCHCPSCEGESKAQEKYAQMEQRLQELESKNKKLVEENEWLRKRDCNASIELCYDDGNNPFARETLQIVDVGVSDNCYVVESKVVSKLQNRNKKIDDFVAEFANEPCEYGDNCPDFVKLNHYKCVHCRAKEALKDINGK